MLVGIYAGMYVCTYDRTSYKMIVQGTIVQGIENTSHQEQMMHACMYVCIYIHAFMHACMYVCMYVCTYDT